MATLQATSITGTMTATSFSGSGSSLNTLSTSQITTGAVTKSALPTGSVINATTYSNSTRISTPSQANYDAFSWTVNKVNSGSKLHIVGIVPCFGQTNSGNYFCMTVAGTRFFTGIIDHTEYGGYHIVSVNQYITGVSTTGNITVAFGWSTNDGGSNRPTNTINQNNNEDGRNRQQGSQFIVWEIA